MFLLSSINPLSFSSASNAIMPLVIIAIILDFAVVSVWYFIGSFLNNSKIKEGAKTEAYQAVGTAILAMIIIGILLFLATSFDSVLTNSNFFYSSSSSSSAAPASPGTISTLCSNLYTTSFINIIGTNSFGASTNTFLKSSYSKFPGLCAYTSLDSPTRHIDYPLVASGIILANLTNQTAHNLNSLFVFDSFIGYLSMLTPTMSWCIPAVDALLDPIPTMASCSAVGGIIAVPEGLAGIATALPILYIRYAATPYAGFDIVYSELGTLGALLTTALNSFIAQFLFIIISLYSWPVLIFSGLVLRATIFTRKIGGLLIAVGIAMILIFPAVFLLEYLGLGNGIGNLISSSPSSCSANPSASGCIGGIYGFNTIATNPITFIPGYPSDAPVQWSSGTPVQDPYTLNFFIEPQLNKIAYYYQCWPSNDNLLEAEAIDSIEFLVPGSSLVTLVYTGVGSLVTPGVPHMVITDNCGPNSLLRAFFQFMEAYGIIGVTAYFLPIINIFIVISSIIGLSGLLGGDTNLAGLSKII